VAFTKNNDLYTINVKIKQQYRLTTDGSETILNGYASWIYMEEILGRASAYRSFWWSPDSKKIAFFRTDNSMVPEFTITDAGGQHGIVEKMRYPKAGDTNPQVKIGIIAPEGSNIAWADFNAQEDQYFGAPYWTPDGNSLIVQWMNTGQDNLKLWTVSPATGTKKELYNEKQKTWI
jgi:dipeptidyl-peptidase-4